MAKGETVSIDQVDVRSSMVVKRLGADGPEQYVRIVLHAELPGQTELKRIHALELMGKDTLIATFERAQKKLPGVEGGPKD